MLNSIDLNDKSYEDLIAEAIARIPLYSNEWTNFNRSDPGITVLQNLSAFSILQQASINQVTDPIRRRLLKLLGYEATQHRDATLLLQAPATHHDPLPVHYQLTTGSLTFESATPITFDPWGLKAVLTHHKGNWQDITYLLNPKVVSSALPFGRDPQENDAMCLMLEGAPATDRPLTLWIQVAEEDQRVPFQGEGDPLFATTLWQYWTAEGWADAQAVDETRGLLVSGSVTLTLKNGAPVPFEDAPTAGCALRCVLKEAHYDCPPRLHSLSANLFPMAQRQTKAAGLLFSGSSSIEVHSALAAKGNIFVYCREKKGQPYRQYTQYSGVHSQGRFFTMEPMEDGIVLNFDKNRFGYAPGQGWGAVRVLCYDNDMVHHRDLGLVYGYDEQVIDMPLVSSVLPQHFSLLAQWEDRDGQMAYAFINPNNTDPDTLCYQVNAQEGQVQIVHPGLGVSYRLFICDCVTTAGAQGNIRSGNVLERRGGFDGHQLLEAFTAPAPGRGGQSFEGVEDLRRRFAANARSVTTAVLPSDYDTLVHRTPGLRIHKVKSVPFPHENLVKITIKPNIPTPYPQLSPLYLQQIQRWLEPRRMLTTRIELLQPRYVPVDVNATIYIKSYYEGAKEMIESLLQESLDYVNGPHSFGERVRFNEIYQALTALPCVVGVDALYLMAGAREGITSVGSDLQLDDQTLCYPGRFQLQLHAHTHGAIERGR